MSLGHEGVARWVREAERARDEAYPVVEGDAFGTLREERQREVYRRRKVMYTLRSGPWVPVGPEMILVVHDGETRTYGCRVFYKEPRTTPGVERLDVVADREAISELRFHRDPVVRLVAEKVGEFHELRVKLSEMGEAAPARRVFYASDL